MDPFAVLEETGRAIDLFSTGADVSSEAVQQAGGWVLAVPVIVADPNLRAAWEAAGDGSRRDLLTAAAALAAVVDEVDADLDVEEFPDASALLELAREELTDRSKPDSLLPASPLAPPLGPTNIYAAGFVCDSTEATETKLRTYAVLAAISWAAKL